MFNIAVYKVGDVLESVYTNNGNEIKKVSRNMISGLYIVYEQNSGIQSNILSDHDSLIDYSIITTISGNTVNNNEELYAQLKALL